jgi:glycine dehydrogenase subunit 2
VLPLQDFRVQEITSNSQGTLDLDSFRKAMNDEVAGIMLTCPNTHGLFETDIQEIADKHINTTLYSITMGQT